MSEPETEAITPTPSPSTDPATTDPEGVGHATTAWRASDSTEVEDRTLTFLRVSPGNPEGRPAQSLDRIDGLAATGVVLLGRYALDRELGRGGMGLVYLARDRRLDRPVAIKVILPRDPGEGLDFDPSDRVRDQFTEEARIGASLTHPAIATVHDHGEHEGTPFTVFEYIPGETLRSLVARRGRLPLDEVRLIVGSLAQALDFAHARQVVHRDLKPENVRATQQGQWKILDLGLASEFDRQEQGTGFRGTPAYASPEQAAERPCDGRADQYALALMTYEMLTGRRVFASRSWRQLLEMHRSLAPDLDGLHEFGLPESARAALARALEKEPGLRFATCEEFAVALGCRLLSAPASPPEILDEVGIEAMSGAWRSARLPAFGRLRRDDQINLALTRDDLWCAYRDELRRWPLGSFEVVGIGRDRPESEAAPKAVAAAPKGIEAAPREIEAAEKVRREHLAFESQLRSIGLIHLGIALTTGCIALLWAAALLKPMTPESKARIVRLVPTFLVSMGAIAAILGPIGVGLRRFRRWARLAAIGVWVAASIGIIATFAVQYALHGWPPAGPRGPVLVIGVFLSLCLGMLGNLMNRKAATICTSRYEEAVKLTPTLGRSAPRHRRRADRPGVEPAPVEIQAPEQVRREHLKAEARVRSTAIVHLGIAVTLALVAVEFIAIPIVAPMLDGGKSTPSNSAQTAKMMALWAIVPGILALVYGWIGLGLRRLRRWARLAAFGIAATEAIALLSGFVTLLAHSPWPRDRAAGTILFLSVVLIFLLASLFGVAGRMIGRKGATVCTPGYREVIASTPSIAPNRFPIGAFRSSRTLRLRLRVGAGEVRQSFRFFNKEECGHWARLLATAREVEPTPGPGGDPEPIVLLRHRPGLRFHLLGVVDSRAEARSSAEAGLLFRAAVLGADAVVDVHEEQLPEFGRTLRRLSGTAVRAVDAEGRAELNTRWYADRVGKVALWMMAFVAIGFLKNLADASVTLGALASTGAYGPNGSETVRSAWVALAMIVLIHLWPAIVFAAFRRLRWPQLAIPAAVTAVALGARFMGNPLGIVLAAVESGRWMVMGGRLLLTIPGALTMLLAGVFLARRTVQTYRGYRRLASDAGVKPPRVRTTLARLALILSIAYGIGLLAFQVWASYNVSIGPQSPL